MRDTQPVTVILNAGSGHGDRATVEQAIRDGFEAAGREYRIVVADSADEVARQAHLACRLPDPNVVVAAGGDGTINLVAGIVLDCDLPGFRAALIRENHTLKRALSDPRLFSGIGNAYSDEILHRAGLSPVALTQRLPEEAVERLFAASQAILHEWVKRLRKETGNAFPEKVTAFRSGMAVHGRFQKPCPVCGTAVQRIAHAENEANYCPCCQTGGKLLADRALSRLLKTDWPRTLEEMENRKATARRDKAGLDEGGRESL